MATATKTHERNTTARPAPASAGVFFLPEAPVPRSPKKASPPGKAATTPVLHFRLNDKAKSRLVIDVLRPDCLTHHGFGRFLTGIMRGEIAATREAYAAIEKAKFLRGVRPLEIFTTPVIGFCAEDLALADLSLHEGAWEWFSRRCVVPGEDFEPGTTKFGEKWNAAGSFATTRMFEVHRYAENKIVIERPFSSREMTLSLFEAQQLIDALQKALNVD